MKLLQKLLLSAVATLSLTGQCYSMDAGTADVAEADFFATIPDKFLTQIIQTTLTQAANDDPTLCKLGDTCKHLKATSHRFRAIFKTPGIGQNILAKALGNSTIDPNKALLEISKHGKHKWLIPRLVKTGADVNIQDYSLKNTPLHYAAGRGHLLVVQALLHARADVNAQDYSGSTPLHCAALNGHITVVQELLQARANVNAQDHCGSTPLHCAALNGHITVSQELIHAGANVNAQDCLFGKTPLHLAVTNKYLWVSIRLIRAGANVNTQDRDEKTPLHYAIYNCDKKLTPVLIKAGAHQ